jgi:hypothetical protein
MMAPRTSAPSHHSEARHFAAIVEAPFELGKPQEHVQRQSVHGRCSIELLGDRHERDGSGIKGLDQLGEVRQRAGEAVDLVARARLRQLDRLPPSILVVPTS